VIPPKFFAGNKGVWATTEFSCGLAAIREAGTPLHNFGYIDKSGDWAFKPIYKQASYFDDSRGGDCIAQVTLQETDFSKLWAAGVPHSRMGFYHRKVALDVFLTQYNVFELDRDTIHKLLGTPDRVTPPSESYRIESASYVDFCYGPAGVCKYRYSWMPPNEWFDPTHPNTGDW